MVDLPGHDSPLLAPLELKTGRPHVSHHAQVLLYFLLLASRHGGPVLDGVLWYTGQQKPQLLKHKAVEVRCLLCVLNGRSHNSGLGEANKPPLLNQAQRIMLLSHRLRRSCSSATGWRLRWCMGRRCLM